jgi:hypothetical protein
VQIDFVVETSGQVKSVAIVGTVPEDVIPQVRAKVQGWFFEPVMKDGVPKATPLSVRGRILIMNPDKPPRPQ